MTNLLASPHHSGEPPGSAGLLLPLNPSFAGHQTFALRHGWLKKGFDALLDDAHIFNRPDAPVTLGVGKNMVASIRHWLLATRVAQSSGRALAATPFGLSLFGAQNDGYDPYLEDPATLWLLHWKLCGPNSEAFTWSWTFNFWREWEWTRDALTDAVAQAASVRVSKALSRETFARDVSVLMQTYIGSDERGQNSEDGLDCPLRDLGLLRRGFDRRLHFAIGPKPSLPLAVFAWSLGQFWNWKHARSETVSAREIVHGEGSPGVVFKLDEEAVFSYLDALADITQGALRFEDTPLVRQVVRQNAFSGDALLDAHFA